MPGLFAVPVTISIHKALASLDTPFWLDKPPSSNFNPQGSREPRRIITDVCLKRKIFQSTRLSRASTPGNTVNYCKTAISIHKALASLDMMQTRCSVSCKIFQSTRLSRASTSIDEMLNALPKISIHKALASLDQTIPPFHLFYNISIHKALASLDEDGFPRLQVIDDFNPQGSREPRLAGVYTHTMKRDISIHKALASLDLGIYSL